MFLPLLFNLRFNCKEPLVENLSFVWWFVASFRLIGVDSLLSVSEKLPELEFPLEKLNVGRYIILVRLTNFHSKRKLAEIALVFPSDWLFCREN